MYLYSLILISSRIFRN